MPFVARVFTFDQLLASNLDDHDRLIIQVRLADVKIKYSDLKLSIKANACGRYICQVLNSTQLNKPPRKMAHKREEAGRSLSLYPDSLKNSPVVFSNVCSVLQCNIVSGKRFYSSITLTVKKFFLISK